MTRVLDAHMHLLRHALGGAGYAVDVMRRKMEEAGVCGAWAMTLEGCYGGDTRKWNEWLLNCVVSHRDFFIPFCTVDPKSGPAAVEEFEYFVRERGMKGLKIHNWLCAVSSTDPAMDELAAACSRLKVPMVVHDGTPPYCTPLQFARLAERHRDTVIILGHSGLKDMWPDALRAAVRLDNLYLCASSPHAGALQAALRTIGSGRLLFGSDCGWVNSEWHLRERIHAVEALRGLGVAECAIRNILCENADRLMQSGRKDMSHGN